LEPFCCSDSFLVLLTFGACVPGISWYHDVSHSWLTFFISPVEWDPHQLNPNRPSQPKSPDAVAGDANGDHQQENT